MMKRMMTMKVALLLMSLLLVVEMVVGNPLSVYDEDDDILRRELLEKLEERGAPGSDWCAQWGDYCVPDSKIEFAKCCGGLRCTCGSTIFGTDHKCQCKRESIFG